MHASTKTPAPVPELSIDEAFQKMPGHHRSYIASLVPHWHPEPSPENNVQMSGAALLPLDILLAGAEDNEGLRDYYFRIEICRIEHECGIPRNHLETALKTATEKHWISQSDDKYYITGNGIEALRFIGARHLKEEVAKARKRIQDLDIG